MAEGTHQTNGLPRSLSLNFPENSILEKIKAKEFQTHIIFYEKLLR